MDRLTDRAQLDGWIPVRLSWDGGRPIVEWCYLGSQGFANLSSDRTLEECLHRPFNLLFSHRTPIEVLGQWSDTSPGLVPTGFIFHVSQTGSSVLARILSAVPDSLVLRETLPIDSILRAHFHDPHVTDEQRMVWLRWMMSAFSQLPGGGFRHFFFKFHPWNLLELPLIRRAFPNVPWIFIYRDPVETLRSQLDHRGPHMIPGLIDASLFGMDDHEIYGMEPEEYGARVLASICQAALGNHTDGGMLVKYMDLPAAMSSPISEFFGVNQAEPETMKLAAGLQRQSPAIGFRNDFAESPTKIADRVRQAASRWLYPVYEKLEKVRLESAASLASDFRQQAR